MQDVGLEKKWRRATNSWNTLDMYVTSWNIFIFLASPYETNVTFVWQQTDIIT